MIFRVKCLLRLKVINLIGSFRFKVYNKHIQYDFIIKRNVTVISGNSGVGKTALIDLLKEYMLMSSRNKKLNSITIETNSDWLVWDDSLLRNNYFKTINSKIIFIDEDIDFIFTKEFSSFVKHSDNYFVLIRRDNLSNLGKLSRVVFSIDEVYTIVNSGKYNKFLRVYNNFDKIIKKPDIIIVEDSNSGYDFFKYVSNINNIECICAYGKDKILNLIDNNLSYLSTKEVLIIADGAAFGSNIILIKNTVAKYDNIKFWLPESFEWLILNSDMFNRHIGDILYNTSKYIDISKFLSWERYFNYLLTHYTLNMFCAYNKTKSLSECYLRDCCCFSERCIYTKDVTI